MSEKLTSTASTLDYGSAPLTNLSGQSKATLTMWLYPPTACTPHRVWGAYDPAGPTGLSAFYWVQNTAPLQVGTSGYGLGLLVANDDAGTTAAYTSNIMNASAWNHIVISYDGTQTGDDLKLKMWVNGTEIALGFSPGNNTMPSTIGAMSGGDASCLSEDPESGTTFYYIAEVGLWCGEALRDEGIIDLLSASSNAKRPPDCGFSGLDHYWSFDGTLVDSVGSSNATRTGSTASDALHPPMESLGGGGTAYGGKTGTGLNKGMSRGLNRHIGRVTA